MMNPQQASPATASETVLNSPLLMAPCLAALLMISLCNYHLISVSYTDPIEIAALVARATVPLLSVALLCTLLLIIHLTKHRLTGKKLRLVFYIAPIVIAASATGNHIQVLKEGGLDVELKVVEGDLLWGGVVSKRLPDIDRILERAQGKLRRIIVSDLQGSEYINAENMAIYLAVHATDGVSVDGSCSHACALFWLMNDKRSLSDEARLGLPGDSGVFAAPHEIFVAVLTSALHNAGAEVSVAEKTVRSVPTGSVTWMSRSDLQQLNVTMFDSLL